MNKKENLIYFIKCRFKGNGVFTVCSTGEDIIFANVNDYKYFTIGESYEITYEKDTLDIRVVGN